ncbi:hypothetical protein [Flavobacterium piscis]|uniref:Lipoprotein n=1 Tax=Flavobacterium piscis TaxID=1114874 RepID=A0ABU1Y713_9FLAO|nr:hypothetical protein [Flavobacterium piscis]MDR7210014.1 hypothetical protein [Flavobacterium piscis]
MKKLFSWTILGVLFLACSGTKNTGEKWMGEYKNNLIKNWGPPIRILNNAESGEILVYAEQVFLNSDNSKGSKIAGQNYWNYNYMYVNKEGEIFSVRSEKQNFPPQAIDSQKMIGMNLLTVK